MIHPSAEVLTEQIGKETQIWQNVIILKEAKIGNNCNCFIENKVIIGDNVTIKVGVSIWDNTHIGDNVFIGPNATFTNDMIPRSKVYPSKFLKTIVENNASIGANSTLIGGNKIGAYSMIGAGSVVTKPIPPFSVWYGNPAKQKGFITREGVMLGIDLVDKEGNKHKLVNGELIIE